MICDAYLALLEFGNPGEIYNVCSGIPRSLRNVVDELISITGHPIEISVNPDFVRSNEVRCMCGDPKKLIELLSKNNVALDIPPLKQTLEAMLTQAVI